MVYFSTEIWLISAKLNFIFSKNDTKFSIARSVGTAWPISLKPVPFGRYLPPLHFFFSKSFSILNYLTGNCDRKRRVGNQWYWIWQNCDQCRKLFNINTRLPNPNSQSCRCEMLYKDKAMLPRIKSPTTSGTLDSSSFDIVWPCCERLLAIWKIELKISNVDLFS